MGTAAAIALGFLAALAWLAWAALYGSRETAGIVGLVAGPVGELPARVTVRGALRDAAIVHNLDPAWLDALGWVESRWNLAAVNQAGADGARGGAWGPTQITARTARAWGYGGPMEDLTSDPTLAADLTAAMVADGFAERGGMLYHFGRPTSLAQVGAVWNAGRLPGDPSLPIATGAYIGRLESAADTLPGMVA